MGGSNRGGFEGGFLLFGFLLRLKKGEMAPRDFAPSALAAALPVGLGPLTKEKKREERKEEGGGGKEESQWAAAHKGN